MNTYENLAKQAIHLGRIALGALLADNDIFDNAGLVKTDFADPVHRRIFEIISEHIASGEDINPAVLGYATAAEPPIGGTTSLADYAGNTLACVAFEFTSGTFGLLRDLAARRIIYNLGKTLTANVLNTSTPIGALLDDATRQIDSIRAGTTTRKWDWSWDEAADREIERMGSNQKPDVITSGLADLDRMLGGGFHRREFVLIGGRPSMGKSMAMQSMALRMARAGHGVIIFSLEMGADELMRRALCDIAFTGDAPIEYSRLQSQKLSEHEQHRIRVARAAWRKMPLVIVDRRGLTVGQILSRAREQARIFEANGIRLGAVCIDHLGHVRASDRYAGNRVNEVGELSGAMMAAASDLDCLLFCAHQLNRSSEQREDARPKLSDLRNSGDLEQDAHTVLFVHREAYGLERTKGNDDQKEAIRKALLDEARHEMEIIVAKQRNGPVGTVEVYCNPGANALRNMANYRHLAGRSAA